MSELRSDADCAASWCADDPWCGLTCAVDVLGHKWHPVVVHRLLARGPLGFGELADDVGAITNKVLSETLADLEAAAVVDRTVVDDRPVRVEYSLTDDGEALAPAIEALQDWGEQYLVD
ncbi:helix-turn-helix transcriptional regulator [Halomicroarcula sp. S1AR25-4]|uniref:winged helix-turn-helix transcriptional regulator n=1 Tax=Haloarcula sp. S1AR25-4 TaxID=2950538 RepID=UPI0028752E64|nr:helix-turn-helix domain-containing protein [Halomicroarcula sp. S1AR25-4]MDS0278891.1 helix-turn-helix transcriptional regulator [Halomicroarcula sp. S1AR25-4]